LIIDCHVHLNRYHDDAPRSLAERHRALKSEMQRHGVAHAVVLSSYKVNDDRPGLDELLALSAGDAQLRLVAGVCVAQWGSQQRDRLRGLLAARALCGLKLYPGYESFYVHDPALRGVYELAAEFGVPVMVHTGDTFNPRALVKHAHPLHLDEVAVAHRDVTFVLCHLGNPWFADAMEVIYKNENVVGDISGLTLGAFQPRSEPYYVHDVKKAVAYINDPTKLLFGTDWPICDVGSYLEFVDKLGLSPDERAQLLGRNAARVFGLPG
jgi:predicted TIM-barrel fold metal-dependent hydrolase